MDGQAQAGPAGTGNVLVYFFVLSVDLFLFFYFFYFFSVLDGPRTGSAIGGCRRPFRWKAGLRCNKGNQVPNWNGRTDGRTGLVMAVETERGLLSGRKERRFKERKKERENERPKKERKQLQKRACPRTMEGEIEFGCSSSSPRLFF